MWLAGAVFAVLLPWLFPNARAGFGWWLLPWTALWMLVGIVCTITLLRALIGEDTVAVQPSHVELARRIGPVRRARSLDRARIRSVRYRLEDNAVVIDTDSRTELVSTLGTPDEQDAVIEWLQKRLALPNDTPPTDSIETPPGWSVTMHGNAARIRRAEGAWWPREYRVRQGELVVHTRFLWWKSQRSFRNARLEVAMVPDETDMRAILQVIEGDREDTITWDNFDHGSIVVLARMLSAQTGFPLKVPDDLK